MEEARDEGVESAFAILMVAYGTFACLVGAVAALLIGEVIEKLQLPAGW
jgi:hypothetical protein